MLSVVVVALGSATFNTNAPPLRSELSLVRSSILYADQITVLSPYLDVAGMHEDLRERLARLSATQNSLEAQASTHDDAQLGAIVAGLRRALGNVIDPPSDPTAGRPEIAELFRRHDDVIRHVPILQSSNAAGSFEQEFVTTLLPFLTDPAAHAVFDARAGELIRLLAATDGRLGSGAITQRHREAELGAGLIARLPAFPQAPIDELLDIKSELAGPLLNYRSAVAKLEEGMSQTLGSRDIDDAIQATWRKVVGPAVSQLEDELTDTSFVRELARSASTSARDLVITGASLSIAVTTLTELAAALTAGSALAGASLQAVATAAKDKFQHRKDLRKRDFYYLQQLQQRALS